ncbi:MAG: FAD-binding oxidoreductase [Thermoplasmatota archaeon]
MAYDTVYSSGAGLGDDVIAQLRSIMPDGVSTRESDRVVYGKDYWPISLRWLLDGRLPALPDAVVWPETVEHVAAVMQLANERGFPVVPYGEGSGVVGGAVPVQGGVMLDMRRMHDIVSIDDQGLMATVQTGINGMTLERELNRAGYTLGHIPQSLYCSSLGGWLACRAAGQFSTKYGKIEDMLVALEAVLPDGTVIRSRPVPRTSTGPRVERLMLGSEGTLGVVTEATLKIWPYPERRALHAYTFHGIADALEATRHILRKNVYPAVMRIYDEHETLRHFDVKHRCMLILVMEGDPELVELEETIAARMCREHSGHDEGEAPAERWVDTRFKVKESSEFTPRGFIFDTVEISVGWRQALQTYNAIIEAMRNVTGVVVASGHASHFYPQGVCFYFTFGGVPRKRSPFEFYRAVWDAIMASCLQHDGSISHHHGIGLIRQPWLADELDGRLQMLQHIKQALDPNNVMNPGKLSDCREDDHG